MISSMDNSLGARRSEVGGKSECGGMSLHETCKCSSAKNRGTYVGG
jgi:hypothetical protein